MQYCTQSTWLRMQQRIRSICMQSLIEWQTTKTWKELPISDRLFPILCCRCCFYFLSLLSKKIRFLKQVEKFDEKKNQAQTLIQVKCASNERSNALGARYNKRKSFSNQFVRFEALSQANCVIALHSLSSSSSSVLLLLYMIEWNEEKNNEEKDETQKKDRYLYCNWTVSKCN